MHARRAQGVVFVRSENGSAHHRLCKTPFRPAKGVQRQRPRRTTPREDAERRRRTAAQPHWSTVAESLRRLVKIVKTTFLMALKKIEDVDLMDDARIRIDFVKD